MALPSGTRLGAYEIQAPIGAGGMGEVYRAKDARLDRTVAIKVLPEAFARDHERLSRFEREARLLAQLNHPGIATLHGFERSGETPFLVMELVEGDTLAEHIERGPIRWEEARQLFAQIAEALEAAHLKGILHRDLKPANIKITPEGRVKILDFGLARAYQEEDAGAEAEKSQSPTLTRGTALGAILGTASYMSPEQARGKPLDRRTDVWAFGCCLYEALSGKKPFEGETITDILAAVVKNDPDWSRLPDATPRPVRYVLRRALKKDPKDRLRDAGDARLLMEDVDEIVTVPRSQGRLAAAAIGAVLVAGLVGWSLRRESPPPVMRFATAIPQTEAFDAVRSRIAVSPDGRRLVHRYSQDGRSGLFLRALSELSPTLIPGTERGTSAFFSPDGEWIAFFEGSDLVKVGLDTGTRVTLARGIGISVFAGTYLTGSWGDDDSIVFTGDGTVFRVPASGGPAEEATALDAERGEIAHYWPDVLPGGKAFLYNAVGPSGRKDILAKRFTDSERRVVLEDGVSPRYLATGQLLFMRRGTLYAVGFDLRRLEVTGEPVPVVHDVEMDSYGDFEFAQYAVSASGNLAYLVEATVRRGSSLVWVDRSGNATPVTDERGSYLIPRISHDGRRIAFARLDEATGQRDIWILDMGRGTRTRITFGEGLSTDPVWSPDDRTVAFASTRSASIFRLFSKAADGSGQAVPMGPGREGFIFPRFWLSDGSAIGFYLVGNGDVGIWHLSPEPKEEMLLESAFDEMEPSLSPDGHFLAYVSDESGRREVYVQPFPEGEGRWPISNDGGDEPLWSPSGDELFYRSGNRMMVVPIAYRPGLEPGSPRVLFEGEYERDPYNN
ncbi:MAG TPA: protein kinase, partial [Vicinamibacteria bacterium]|nr:protein kinase [Vicinamibacteria bacterium]